MKFRFQSRVGKKVSGTLEARSREEAEAILERKNLSHVSLEACSDSQSQNYSFLFVLLCAVGLLVLVVSVSRSGFGGREFVASQAPQTTLLRVEGHILAEPALQDEKVEILFPELPTRLRADWREVGDASGHFVIEDELLTEGSSPSFFSLTIKSPTGETLFRKRRVPYPVPGPDGTLPTFKF